LLSTHSFVPPVGLDLPLLELEVLSNSFLLAVHAVDSLLVGQGLIRRLLVGQARPDDDEKDEYGSAAQAGRSFVVFAHDFFSFGVRARREAAGLSQEALAKAANLHRVYISLLERGHRVPSLGTVQMLAKALNTSMSSLVTATERRMDKSGPKSG
jgi:DNA-binding XRE family transcriptional regulator